MKNNFILAKKIQFVLKFLFILSCPALNLVFARNSEKEILILSMLLSLCIGFFLVKKFWNSDIKINWFNLFVSFVISDLFLGIVYSYHFDTNFSLFFYKVSFWKLFICFVLALFSLTLIIYYFITKVKTPVMSFFVSLTKREKTFLIVYSLIFLILIIVIYNLTKVFYFVSGRPYDIIYTTDSSAIFEENAFMNFNASENVAGRQPLFGVFSVPFALMSFILSKIFFMIPNGYAIFLTWVQVILIGLMMIMLARLLNIKDKNRFIFYLFFLSCYSTIIFTFTLEQYIISTFYLVLGIYVYFNMKNGVNYPFSMSVGTLITSGWFFPFAAKDKKVKIWFLNALKCLLFFLIVTILSGQLYFIFNFVSGILNTVDSFGGEGISFWSKLCQYFGFIKSVFLSLPGYITETNQYWLAPINHISKFGVAMLIICFMSVILNRKNKFVISAFSWICFSIILILLIGYGTKENGTNLYSFYFGWAFISLVYMFIDKLIKSDKLKNALVVMICLFLLFVNIPEFLNIIMFGISYYPI